MSPPAQRSNFPQTGELTLTRPDGGVWAYVGLNGTLVPAPHYLAGSKAGSGSEVGVLTDGLPALRLEGVEE